MVRDGVSRTLLIWFFSIVRTHSLILLAAVVFVTACLSFAQDDRPICAPDDILLELKIEGNTLRFHLGESIPVKYSYSAKISGKYFLVNNTNQLAGGSGFEISCSPAAQRTNMSSVSADSFAFDRMLYAFCQGAGGGMGGGCSDCAGELALTAFPIGFGTVPLNTFVRFNKSGTYVCQASSAQVTNMPRAEKLRPALLVKSNPITLNIVEDPAWARAASAEYANAYRTLCRDDATAARSQLQCFDLAQRITYLDIPESLQLETEAFDGRNHRWENGFWDAIMQSLQHADAIRLMAARIRDPDFRVTTTVLTWLAESELKLEQPAAFQEGSPAVYHTQAVEKLRKYVRMLGASLGKKSTDAITESARTYRDLASGDYCEGSPLVPGEEQGHVLTAASSQQ